MRERTGAPRIASFFSFLCGSIAPVGDDEDGLSLSLQEFPLYMTVYFRHRQVKMRHS
jgi:hypothetical protein